MDHRTHKVWLTPQQSALWHEGNWSAWHIERDIVERLEREHIAQPTVVFLANGVLAFGVTRGEIRLIESRRTQCRTRSN